MEETSQSKEKIHEQFDTDPYPHVALDVSAKGNSSLLYIHNLITPYYLRNKKVIETQGKEILDVGCGTGVTSLLLAEANPGTRIVGIDFSPKSIELAKERLQHHGFKDAEFHLLAIEDLPQLERQFDYINCDDVLYLLPDPALGLQAMKSVLAPEGIIRANLHSSLQRVYYYRAQEVCKLMGLMDGNPGELEIDIVRELFKALKDQAPLKAYTWRKQHEQDNEWFLMNYLFQGDKGYTIPQMFSALRTADLEFISMVNWWQWELLELFNQPDNLPVFLGIALPELDVEHRLHLFELFNPIHRLLDFWCGHPNQTQPFVSVAEWTQTDWMQAKAYLPLELKTTAVKEELVRCITQLIPFEIHKYLPVFGHQSLIDSSMAACLLPLWDAPQPVLSLVRMWQKLRPVHPVTLEPMIEEEAFETVKQALTGLESLGYVLLDRQA